MNKNTTFILLSLINIAIVDTLVAQGHLTYKVERQYFGQWQRLADIEIWFSGSSLCVVRGKQKTIYSLTENKKKISFSEDGLRYFKSDIHEHPESVAKTTAEVPIVYRPKYYWTVTRRGSSETLNNSSCTKLLLEGADEFSEKEVEAWVMNDMPEYLRPFPPLYALSNYFGSEENRDFFRVDSLLTNGILLRKREIVVPPNPVPDSYIVETTLITMENVVVDSVFSIPAKAQEVRSTQEL